MKSAIAYLVCQLLKLRYQLKIKANLSTPLKNTLILPNHPAEIDPVILTSILWSNFQPRPVVLETIYKMPFFNSIFSFINAIPMPDMEQGSGFYKRRRINTTLREISQKINNGENILIYPSGRLSIDGREVLGGASGTFSIIQGLENANILLIRSRGLFGSRFSKAQTHGSRPDLIQAFISSTKTLIKNLILFTPRRRVDIECELISLDKLKSKSLSELNSFLESWYGPKEDPSFIRDFFLSKKVLKPAEKITNKEAIIEINPEHQKKILEQISKLSEKNVSELSGEMKLGEDLGLDSLTVAELLTWLHDEFDAHEADLASLTTVNSVLLASSNHKPTNNNDTNLETPKTWTSLDCKRRSPQLIESKNLAEAFIRSAKSNPDQIACSDTLVGVKTYRELLTASLLVSEQLKKLADHQIGIVLPASSMTAITALAVLISGKTPVFLNWTAGSRAIEQSVNLLSLKTIISAGTVLDNINQDLSALEDKFLLLEEIKNSANLKNKLKALLQTFLPTNTLIKNYGLDLISSEATAAILFTSGSEASPKGVPLSHFNILENIKSIAEFFKFQKEDVFYGFLPPFHSFGLTVTTFLPLLSGIKVTFCPNPNESKKISSGCKSWKVSAMAGTPAFLRGILSAGEPADFTSLRLLMSGADKLGEDVRELCKKKAPQAMLLEGYGITECSPVVCAQTIDRPSEGVGLPLPRVKIKIVDLNTHQELPNGQQGLILIQGPNVFSGYIGKSSDPFLEVDQEKWYNSGDLGLIKNGSLIISGRLKRFIKIGGEMISIPAIEEALIKDFSSTLSNLSLAIVDSQVDDNQKPILTIFSNNTEITKERVQEKLKSQGFPSIIRIHESRFLEELPLLGSGKIDIQKLKALL